MLSSIRRRELGEDVEFVCPSCHGELDWTDSGWVCSSEKFIFPITNGIPDFILPSRRERTDAFLSLYQEVRRQEGWGSENLDYYFSLPYRDETHCQRKLWKIRAKTFDCFLNLLAAMKPNALLRVLDVGAGNCWMAIRLAEAGHRVVAVDSNLDSLDGLGVGARLKASGMLKFSCVRAEFDYLPFQEASFDAVVYNASLHYSVNINETILSALHLTKNDGAVFILDSPIYKSAESGATMVRARQNEFQMKYGISVPDEFAGSFLTYAQLDQVGLEYKVEYHSPDYGFLWKLRPTLAHLLSKREPASFHIAALTKS